MSITTPDSEIPRDRFQRPMVVPPEGGKAVPYTRCTTYVGVLEDTFNLSRWQQRMVAIGLSERPDLLLQVASTDRDDKKTLDTVCGSAMEAAKAHAAATVGTALHALTERLDRGQDIGVVPKDYRADLDAYTAATADLTAVHIEQFTVVDDLQVGGTPDRVVDINGRLYIADLKTGSIDYGVGKIAMQLAMYAHGIGYDHQTSERFDLGTIDQTMGIIIHLPAGQGKCELVEVDLAAGWEAISLATQVREWRKRKDLTRPHTAEIIMATAPAVADKQTGIDDRAAKQQRAALEDRIATATSLDQLRTIWSENQATWNEDLTALAAARKALLEQNVVA